MFDEYYEGERVLDFFITEKKTKEIIKTVKKYLQLYYLIEYSRNAKIIRISKKVLKVEINIFIKRHISFFKLFFMNKKVFFKIENGKTFKNIVNKIILY